MNHGRSRKRHVVHVKKSKTSVWEWIVGITGLFLIGVISMLAEFSAAARARWRGAHWHRAH